MPKKNIQSIHYLRIMACLMVIMIHISATPVVSLTLNSPAQIFFIFLNHLSKPAVPIFIFISGFLLNFIYDQRSLHFIEYYKKRLPKLIIPYVLWCILYYGVYAGFGYYPLNLTFFIKGVLEGTFIYHLYFMVIIIQFYLLFPVLHWIRLKIKMFPLFFVTLAIQLSLILVIFPYKDRIFLTYFAYFTFGMLVQSQFDLIKRMNHYRLLSFAVFVLVGAFSGFLYWNDLNQVVELSLLFVSIAYVLFAFIAIGALTICFEGVSAKVNLSEKAEKIIVNISGSTQLIYFAHPLFIIAVDLFSPYFSIHSISLKALLSFMSILIILAPIAYWIQIHPLSLKTNKGA